MNFDNKIGLLFTHFFVNKNEQYKFDILEHNINYFNSFKTNFFIVLCGHGFTPPSYITDKIDKLYWENTIDSKEIGRGHPKFCIKGYKILLQNNITTSIKIRGFDFIDNKNLLYNLLSNNDITITEQTCLNKKILGDLLMFGKTSSMLNLWSVLPWNYDISGLYNLFNNALYLNKDINSLLNFISPQEIGWYSLEHNWDINNKKPLNKPNQHLWGEVNNYEYYGGF